MNKRLYPQVSIDAGMCKLIYMQYFSNILIIADAIGASLGPSLPGWCTQHPVAVCVCPPSLESCPPGSLLTPPHPGSPLPSKVAHSQRLAWLSQGQDNFA